MQVTTLESDNTVEISSYFDLLDQGVHEHIELMTKRDDECEDFDQTLPSDEEEANLSMERMKNIVRASTFRHGLMNIPVRMPMKRKLRFDVEPEEQPSTSRDEVDVVDGRQFLKATKLNVEDADSSHSGGLSMRERVSVFFKGGGSKHKLEAENLEMEIEDCDGDSITTALSNKLSGDERQTADSSK